MGDRDVKTAGVELGKAPMGTEYLTWPEIQRQFPKEWVFLDKVATLQRSEAVTGGVVVLHTPDHAEFVRRVFDFPEVVNGALLYTGPDDAEGDEVAGV